jgi:hypothetical protein
MLITNNTFSTFKTLFFTEKISKYREGCIKLKKVDIYHKTAFFKAVPQAREFKRDFSESAIKNHLENVFQLISKINS